MEFFRFPHTPHLAWLGEGTPRDDKVLAPGEADDLLSGEVVVEEKVDGANLGISVGEDGVMRVQNRGTYLTRDNAHPQFRQLFDWLEVRRIELEDALFPSLILFGEWCVAVHSVRYSRLPDWFLAFDVYDREAGRFWSTRRRNELVDRLRLARVPEVARGRFDLDGLLSLMGRSRFTDEPSEGLYIRRESADWLEGRAKLVRAAFTQAIGEHWSKRVMERNALEEG